MDTEYGYISIRATKPWASPYSEKLDRRTDYQSDLYTDQKQIDICLNCPRPTCTDCMDAWKDIRSIQYPIAKRKRKK